MAGPCLPHQFDWIVSLPYATSAERWATVPEPVGSMYQRQSLDSKRASKQLLETKEQASLARFSSSMLSVQLSSLVLICRYPSAVPLNLLHLPQLICSSG